MYAALVPTIGYLLSTIEMSYIRDMFFDVTPILPETIKLVKTDSTVIRRAYSCDSAKQRVTCGTESDTAFLDYRDGWEKIGTGRPHVVDNRRHMATAPIEDDVMSPLKDQHSALLLTPNENFEAISPSASDDIGPDSNDGSTESIPQTPNLTKSLAWSDIIDSTKEKVLRLCHPTSESTSLPTSNRLQSLLTAPEHLNKETPGGVESQRIAGRLYLGAWSNLYSFSNLYAEVSMNSSESQREKDVESQTVSFHKLDSANSGDCK